MYKMDLLLYINFLGLPTYPLIYPFIHENYMHSRDQNGYYMCVYKLI